MTVSVGVMVTPLIVAETTLSPGMVALMLPVVTPPASVGPGCVKDASGLEDESTTLTPWIGLPKASLAVTVIVEDPVITGIEVGEAEIDDWASETPAAFTVTVAV